MPRTSINYLKTIIYKIVCKDLNITDIYVGHTTDFTERKYAHKKRYNGSFNESCNLKVYQKIRENGGWDNWDILEIEKYPCNDSNEAQTRERYWFDQHNSSLNSQRPVISKIELLEYKKIYREKNKLKIQQYWKEYREKNKNELKEKYTCQCGSSIIKYKKNRHETSKKHLKYIESL
jgi:hypothetical protein